MHLEAIVLQYIQQEKPLFDVFTSKTALRWTLFVTKIDVRGWKLHLRYSWNEDSESEDNQCELMSHNQSFIEVCQDGDMGVVKAMVERTQVDTETKNAITGHHCTLQHKVVSSL